MSKGWRTTPLPGNWATIRITVLERDNWVCQLQYTGCTLSASEVDHIDQSSDHQLPNLRAVCSHCHRIRTAHQANTARQAKWGRKRRIEPHPGRRGGG